MKNIFIFAITLLIFINVLSYKVNAYENESILNKSQIIILKKYAERFCSAKAGNFFKGLDNEKKLKYSYFKYMGLQNEEILSKDMYKVLINQIRERCLLNNKEESEINEFILKTKK